MTDNTHAQTNETPPTTTEAAADSPPVDLAVALAQAQAKAQEYLDGWQRARADFANYRKRADKEREDTFQLAVIDTLRKFIPVIDDFDRAMGNILTEDAEREVIKGFSLIHRKLATLLEGAGLAVIDPQGQVFDPALHEAIGQDAPTADIPSGHISAVLQKGYRYGDRVIRPAIVRVAN
ncbi:MAG TPA: nucleotide exchange factor GrpE [Aggregatilineales bacterium]|nr:nucleotide exchange factor GrpE [Anaerolineales bacterium]HRE47552.1 nucleotide exchange factor GrpE [Aggregatilineales bacterium]